MISDKHVQEFKRLYKEHFRRDISDAYVLESATKLIDLVRAVYKPMKKEEFEELKK